MTEAEAWLRPQGKAEPALERLGPTRPLAPSPFSAPTLQPSAHLLPPALRRKDPAIAPIGKQSHPRSPTISTPRGGRRPLGLHAGCRAADFTLSIKSSTFPAVGRVSTRTLARGLGVSSSHGCPRGSWQLQLLLDGGLVQFLTEKHQVPLRALRWQRGL